MATTQLLRNSLIQEKEDVPCHHTSSLFSNLRQLRRYAYWVFAVTPILNGMRLEEPVERIAAQF